MGVAPMVVTARGRTRVGRAALVAAVAMLRRRRGRRGGRGGRIAVEHHQRTRGGRSRRRVPS